MRDHLIRFYNCIFKRHRTSVLTVIKYMSIDFFTEATMNRFIEKNGPIKSTILFTLMGAILSVLTSTLIYFIFLSRGINLNIKYTLSMSAFVPLVVGPLVI